MDYICIPANICLFVFTRPFNAPKAPYTLPRSRALVQVSRSSAPPICSDAVKGRRKSGGHAVKYSAVAPFSGAFLGPGFKGGSCPETNGVLRAALHLTIPGWEHHESRRKIMGEWARVFLCCCLHYCPLRTKHGRFKRSSMCLYIFTLFFPAVPGTGRYY